MLIESVSSLNQYLLIVEEVSSAHYSHENQYRVKQDGELLFRGQDIDYPLLPKIAREVAEFDLLTRESHMLTELRRRGSIYRHLAPLDDWDLLTLAQHHGMATRFLDWSRNPLTAMWFACKDGAVNSAAYVYILLPHWGIGLLDRCVAPSPRKHNGVSILRPNLEDPRVVAQDGWFTVHSVSRKHRRFVPLGENEYHAEGMVKVVVQPGSKQKILENLDVLGISHQTMFPDLGGVCAYLNWASKKVGST